MQNFAELHLKPETLARYGLPDIPYPVAETDLKSAVLGSENIRALFLARHPRATRGSGRQCRGWRQAKKPEIGQFSARAVSFLCLVCG